MTRVPKWLLLAAASTALAQAQNAANGKKVFERLMCAACRGHEGQGGGAGPRIGVKPPPLPVFLAYVRHPAANMPPFTANVVSGAGLTDIHAYLLTRPAPPKDIPLLNQ